MVAPTRSEVSDAGHLSRCISSPGGTRTVPVNALRLFVTDADYLLCLKNSTWRSLFLAASRVLYGPPKFFPLLETTLYPAFTFLIMFNPRFYEDAANPWRKFQSRDCRACATAS